MASGPITSWQIDGETMEIVSDFIIWDTPNPLDSESFLEETSEQPFSSGICLFLPLPPSLTLQHVIFHKIHRNNACGIKTPLVYSQKVGADCLPSEGQLIVKREVSRVQSA